MKLYLMIFFVFLDVAMFPFSCSPKKTHEVVFDTYTYIEESSISIGTLYSYDLPDGEITLPEEIILEEEGYAIAFWYINNDTKEAISFPYTYTDADFIKYYNGHRDSIVIHAQWEKVQEND